MPVIDYATRLASHSPLILLHLAETTGTFADSGSAGTTGTLTGSATRGAPSLIKGSSDLALSLTGGKVTTGPAVNTGSVGLTLVLPIRFNALVTGDVVAIGSQTSGQPHLYVRYVVSSANWRVLCGMTGGQLQVLGTPAVPPVPGREYLLVVTRDDVSGKVSIYWNGRLLGLGTGTGLLALINKTLTLGDAASNYGVDEVAMLPTVLTADEVRNLYLSFVGADDMATEFFTAPTGTYNGAGTVADPLDLQSALRDAGHAFAAAGGATVSMLAGDYTGSFAMDLRGIPTAVSRLQNVRGENVRLLAPANPTTPNLYSTPGACYVEIDGDGRAYAGGIKTIEILNTDPHRIATTPGSNPPATEVGGRGGGAQGPGGQGLYLTVGHDITVKNVWVHDCGNGLNGFDVARNIIAIGCQLSNNGWAATDRGHGHNVYESNVDTPAMPSQKALLWCVSLTPFAAGYKTDSVSAGCDNIRIEGCIASNAGYPGLNYYLDTFGALKTDGAMTVGSAALIGSGFTSAAVGQAVRIEGAGRNGRALLTHIKSYTNPSLVILARPAQTTVTGATYRRAGVLNAWTNNILLGSGGYARVNHDCVIRDVSLWMSPWAVTSLNAWLGYNTNFNENLIVDGLRAMGGSEALQVNRWRDLQVTNSQCLARPIPGLSATYAMDMVEAPVDQFQAGADYPAGALIQPNPKTGYCYRCTTGGVAGAVPVWPTGSGATVTTGAATFTAPTVWQADHFYAANDLVVPTTFSGKTYLCRQGGTSGSTEPTWPSGKNVLTVDGGAIFQNLGSGTEIKPFYPDHFIDDNAYFTTAVPISGSTSPFRLTGYVNPVGTLPLTFAQWQASGFDAASTQINGEPTVTEVVTHWQDPAEGGLLGRGAVAVYNWERLASVTLDLAGLGLVEGQAFEIRDGEDYAATILASGVYGTEAGRVTAIAVSTQGEEIAAPIGWTYDFQSTKPDFLVAVVLPGDVEGEPMPGPEPEPPPLTLEERVTLLEEKVMTLEGICV